MRDALIVDIDGTLALGINKHRKAYEYNLCGEDKPNLFVMALIDTWTHKYKDGIILFCSGRENVTFPGKSKRKDKAYRKVVFNGKEHANCYDLTYHWLTFWLKMPKEKFDWKLYMRKEGDFSADSIVKKNMYHNYIEDNYFVHYVIDDRDQVVRMWREELGMDVAQVAFGNF